MLIRERDFCKSHWSELRKDWAGKHIVIKGEEVLGGYDSFDEALIGGQAMKLPIGTFMIKKITDTDHEIPIQLSGMII